MALAAHPYDVLVCGLGPAGAAAAAAASRRGLRVLAVDRKAVAGIPVQCAELVPGLIGQDVASFAGVRSQSVHRMLTSVEHAAPDEIAPFPGHMIDRARFDRAQVAQAIELGAECRFATAVRCLTPNGAVLDDGIEIVAPLVIGADGPHSRVGRQLGIRNRELVYARQVTVPLASAHDATDIFLAAEIVGGYGWLFPKGEVAHIGVGVAASARPRLKPLLDALHRDLVDAGRVHPQVLSRTGGAIPVGGSLIPFAAREGGLALLAGDAAGLTNPITGAGIHAALVSGALAGEAAADWHAGEHAAGANYAEQLDELFGVSLDRALRRRHELARHRAPDPRALRRAWIAYPEYWRESAPRARMAHEVMV